MTQYLKQFVICKYIAFNTLVMDHQGNWWSNLCKVII